MNLNGFSLRAMTTMSGGLTSSKGKGDSNVMARIFVVDDEDFIRELYKDMFESKGHTVFSAGSGEEAIECIRKMPAKPDAIIMDHRMPGKDGIETTREIRRMDPSIPIIFSSADEGIRDEAIRAGAVSFWTKPFPLGMLIDATMDMLKLKKG
jgi:CheY-like chemotaxis protein